MEAHGIIKIEIANETVYLTFKGSQDAFIDFCQVVLKPLTLVGAKIPHDFNLITANYYEEELTEDELKILTNESTRNN